VARHGEAAYESEGTGLSGGSLTPRGRAQARELGERLRGERVAMVVCSELSRAVQTAEIAAAVLGLPVAVRVGLEELDVGEERGKPFDSSVFDPLMASWSAGELSTGVPGGENGREVVRRVLGVLDDVADQARGETVLVVTHGGVINALWGAIAPGSSAAPDPDGIANGAAYAVTVGTQPSGQTCSVANGSGTVSGANVTNVAVTCANSTFTIGGNVTGLLGNSVTLSLNGTESLPVASNGSFVFTTMLGSGASYAVTVQAQPTSPAEVCTVTGGSGTVAGANVTSVQVDCSDRIFANGYELP